MITKRTELEICLCGRCASDFYASPEYSITRSDPIQVIQDCCCTAVSGGDTTIGFAAAASSFRSDSDEGAEPNAPDPTALLSPAIKE